MKVLIVSDTHRQHRNLEKIIEKVRPVDMMIHLGDTEGEEELIRKLAGCPTHIVRGNNDYFTDLLPEEVFELEGRRIFLTHGHAYMAILGEEELKKAAKNRGADIVMYGHTHRPSLTYEGNLILLNPGSVTYPRQQGRRPSYMLMEIEEGKEVEITLEYLQ